MQPTSRCRSSTRAATRSGAAYSFSTYLSDLSDFLETKFTEHEWVYHQEIKCSFGHPEDLPIINGVTYSASK